MPRGLNKAGDQSLPVCQQCAKAGRYCDRLTIAAQFVEWPGTTSLGATVSKTDDDTTTQFPENPRAALEDARLARLFHHYVSDLSSWYDLSDGSHTFATLVPELALDEPLLFCALMALSAVHLSKTVSRTAGTSAMAQLYHRRCVRLMIGLEEGSHLQARGVALAATCLLRSYEILDEDVDPNRHLQGAYSLAAYAGVSLGILQGGLLAAGFWNYLREDITFSLYENCPLKIDLEMIGPPGHATDESYLNSISLILGQLINSAFAARSISVEEWTLLFNKTQNWFVSLPSRFRPFSSGKRGLASLGALPSVWFLRACHASAMHYYLASVSILTTSAPTEHAVALLQTCGGIETVNPSSPAQEDLLEHTALELFGIAFTTNMSVVLVNSFGPMAYCGRFIRAEAAQQEIIRRLSACKKTIGWPIDRLAKLLQDAWD
ncbi:uncharacterized protein BCR38DRAFT_505005 [Pseudomassariella vexata]|uniref:Fungal-specific transcription factor domain-domain-containing protein n=1 Tax=Pseudomassariella vexata TaxID=1141098 RepID=A0A1Y2DBK8_9PEZI|nr:uncharacterized protein BCR38DRAFT_505005 [Pseudomassariella vexata]ORY56648.1 hypothetical protein BCR38DRAFT_505005 [Pseudomassariella vexata]